VLGRAMELNQYFTITAVFFRVVYQSSFDQNFVRALNKSIEISAGIQKSEFLGYIQLPEAIKREEMHP
jgi:hypothetical protein